jgi:hypothetical protein
LRFSIHDQELDVRVGSRRFVGGEHHPGGSGLRLGQHLRDNREEIRQVPCRLRISGPPPAKHWYRLVIARDSHVDHHV